MLLDLFNRDMLRLSNVAQSIDESVQDVDFEGGTLPTVPDELDAPTISVFKRQYYRGNGVIDGVRITLDRPSATALGLWILAATLQKGRESYCLNLTNGETEVTKIVLYPEVRPVTGVNVREANFVWVPGALESDLRHGSLNRYLSQKCFMAVVNQDDDWADEWANKCVLRGFGKLGASCMMAAFFLDFGLSSSKLNYEYIKDANYSKLLDEDSCEARVEVASAWGGGVMARHTIEH